jgi:hypothetical protein
MALMAELCPDTLASCAANDACMTFLTASGESDEPPTAEAAAAVGPEAAALLKCYMDNVAAFLTADDVNDDAASSGDGNDEKSDADDDTSSGNAIADGNTAPPDAPVVAFCEVGTVSTDGFGNCICADESACQGSGCEITPGFSYYTPYATDAICLAPPCECDADWSDSALAAAYCGGDASLSKGCAGDCGGFGYTWCKVQDDACTWSAWVDVNAFEAGFDQGEPYMRCDATDTPCTTDASDHDAVAIDLFGNPGATCAVVAAQPEGFCALTIIAYTCPVSCQACHTATEYVLDQSEILFGQYGSGCEAANSKTCTQPAIAMVCPESCADTANDGGNDNAMALMAELCPDTLASCAANDACMTFLTASGESDELPTAEAAAAVGPEASALLKCYMDNAEAFADDDSNSGSTLEDNIGDENGSGISTSGSGTELDDNAATQCTATDAPDHDAIVSDLFGNPAATCAVVASQPEGFCVNEFIAYTCPASCEACYTAADYAVDQPEILYNQYGAQCNAVDSETCAQPAVAMVCPKTCADVRGTPPPTESDPVEADGLLSPEPESEEPELIDSSGSSDSGSGFSNPSVGEVFNANTAITVGGNGSETLQLTVFTLKAIPASCPEIVNQPENQEIGCAQALCAVGQCNKTVEAIGCAMLCTDSESAGQRRDGSSSDLMFVLTSDPAAVLETAGAQISFDIRTTTGVTIPVQSSEAETFIVTRFDDKNVRLSELFEAIVRARALVTTPSTTVDDRPDDVGATQAKNNSLSNGEVLAVAFGSFVGAVFLAMCLLHKPPKQPYLASTHTGSGSLTL